RQKRLQKGAVALPATTIAGQYGQIDSAAYDPFIEISQSLGSIPAHFQRARLHTQQVRVADWRHTLAERDIRYQTRHAWHQWMYDRQVVKELEQQLSFYVYFESRADLRYRLGESSLL